MKDLKFINLNKVKRKELIFDKPGNYRVVFKNLSGRLHFKITSENVNLEIYGLYIGKKIDEFKVYTIQHHIAPNSTSNLLIKGVFYDKAKFFYRGLARIEKKAQKSHAYQKNQNLVLSDDVDIDTRPYLEILANDVFCTHGSTTGFLDKDQMFYLKSRGLSQSQAKNLLIEGFIKDVEEKIIQEY